MSIEELKEAHEKGRTIQFRLDGRTWVDWPRPSFDSDPDDYRIKETDKEEEKIKERTPEEIKNRLSNIGEAKRRKKNKGGKI